MLYKDFDEFLRNKNLDFKIKKSGKIGYRIGMDYLSLSRTHVSILGIEFISSNAQSIELDVKYSSPDNTIRDQLTIFRYSSGRLKYKDDEFNNIIEAIEITEPDYTKQILRLYKQYFQSVINETIEKNPVMTSYCGWLDENGYREYLPVTYTVEGRDKFQDLFFNGRIRYLSVQEKATKEDVKYIKFVLEQLLKNNTLLKTFAYSVHSIMWNYFRSYKIDPDFYTDWDKTLFSFCLYGDDIRKCKVIANLYLNFFDVPKDWYLISKKYHVSATSISENTISKLPLYKSVPIIFTRKNDNFTPASSIIKKVHKAREKSVYSFFPVYISNHVINVDEMVNCNVDLVDLEFDYKDRQSMTQYHNAIIALLYTFIHTLSVFSNPDEYPERIVYNYMASRYSQVKTEKNLDSEWLDSHYPEYLLYASTDGFCSYLETTPLKRYANLIRAAAEKSLLEQRDSISIDTISAMPQIDYLKYLHQYINTSLKNPSNNTWIYIGIEKKDKQEFYYLENNVGFENYENYLHKMKIPTLGKHKFAKLLKSQKLLKLPKKGSSNTWSRKNNAYYYLIPKAQFDARFCSHEIMDET